MRITRQPRKGDRIKVAGVIREVKDYSAQMRWAIFTDKSLVKYDPQTMQLIPKGAPIQ